MWYCTMCRCHIKLRLSVWSTPVLSNIAILQASVRDKKVEAPLTVWKMVLQTVSMQKMPPY